MGGVKRAFAVGAFLAGGFAGWASGAVTYPCVEYFFWTAGGRLDVAILRGTSQLTLKVCGVFECHSTTWELGHYEVNGVRFTMDCSDYSIVA